MLTKRRLRIVSIAAFVVFLALGIAPPRSAGLLAASACIASTDGICAVPPNTPVGIGSQSSVGGVADAGTTTIATCPQLLVGAGPSVACSSGSGSGSLSCSIAVQETPLNNGEVYAQSQTTCSEDASISYGYGWDSEVLTGSLNLTRGQQLQVNETYTGPQSNCHSWLIAITATDDFGNQAKPGAGVDYCYG